MLGRVIVTGYTGVSCSPFLTPTLMKLFNLSMKLRDGNPRATELEKLRTRFKTVAGFDVNELKGLVIDEVSFIQPELLGRVSRLMKAIRGRLGGAWNTRACGASRGAPGLRASVRA